MSLWAFETGKREGQKKNNRAFDRYPKHLIKKEGDHRFSDIPMDETTRLEIMAQLEEDRALEKRRIIRRLGLSILVATFLLGACYLLFDFIYV